MTNPRWLEWAQRLQGIAQAGLTYSENLYDLERYRALREIAAEILSEYTCTDLPVVRTLLENETGYATPKVDCRGVIFQGDAILLVKEMSDGGWTLPGGWVDVGEPPSLAVEREVWEESGYQVRAVKLLAVLDRALHGHPPAAFSAYKMFFLCEISGGAPKDSHETAGAAFFAEDAIPPLSIQRTSMDEIETMFAYHRDPGRPATFD